MVYWHDWPHTGMALRLVVESSLPAIEKVTLAATHARLFVQRLANAGRGAEWLQGDFPSKKKSGANRIERGGFDPEERGNGAKARGPITRKRSAPSSEPISVSRVRPGFRGELAGEYQRRPQAGAEPIFILPPTVRPEERLPDGLPLGCADNGRSTIPSPLRLYLPELHYDPGHLNEAGARGVCWLLAHDLALQQTR